MTPVDLMRKAIPSLMLVVESERGALPFADLLAAAIEGGCDAIQVRDRAIPRTERRRRLAEAVEIAAGQVQVIVNGDLELAAEFGVGLHLPEGGIAAIEARGALGPAVLIGRSVHSPAAATASEGADYLLAGHAYATLSHPGEPPLGMDGLGRIVEVARSPVLAIGGVTSERVAAVLSVGAWGIAVIGAVAAAPDRAAAQAAARSLREAVDRCLAER
jgi:thiamine-phosphate diphosphorylase